MFPIFFAAVAGAILGSRVNHDIHVDFDGSQMLKEALERIRATEILEDMQKQFRYSMANLAANSDLMLMNLEETTASVARDVHTLTTALVVLIAVVILYIVWCGVLRGLAEARERRAPQARLAFNDQGKLVLCEANEKNMALLQALHAGGS